VRTSTVPKDTASPSSIHIQLPSAEDILSERDSKDYNKRQSYPNFIVGNNNSSNVFNASTGMGESSDAKEMNTLLENDVEAEEQAQRVRCSNSRLFGIKVSTLISLKILISPF